MSFDEWMEIEVINISFGGELRSLGTLRHGTSYSFQFCYLHCDLNDSRMISNSLLSLATTNNSSNKHPIYYHDKVYPT
jgi:hypothetical protein